MDGSSDRRCVATNGRGQRCGKWAIRGATVCLAHGGAIGRVRDAADRREQERRALKVAASIKVPDYDGNPFEAISDALRRAHALVYRLGTLVDGLADGSLRYQGRAGEQMGGEVSAYQAALRDLVSVADKMLRLRLDERSVQVTERQVDALVRAIELTVGEVFPGDLEAAHKARKAMSRHLRALGSGEAG